MGGGNHVHPVSHSFHVGCTDGAEFGAEATHAGMEPLLAREQRPDDES